MSFRVVKKRFRLLGTGAALPGPPLTGEELLAAVNRLGVRKAKRGLAIARRMGVETRHACRDFNDFLEAPREGDTNPDMCARALSQALDAAGIEIGDLSYIIGHTTSPHTLLPPNISWVADLIGYSGPYMELRQACTGFANALQVAAGMLNDPSQGPVAIVGSEAGSVFFDPRSIDGDLNELVSLIQMGDGAGAAVIGPDGGSSVPTIESLFMGAAGNGKKPGLSLNFGGSGSTFVPPGKQLQWFEHDAGRVRDYGPELFVLGLAAARECGIDPNEVTWIIPHQANGVMGEFLGPQLKLPPEKFYINADRVGNTGSAAIWLALHDLRTSGKLRPGDTALILGAEATKYLYGGFLYRHAD